MYTARINHNACTHPATNAGRTECRNRLAKLRTELAADRPTPAPAVTVRPWMTQAHTDISRMMDVAHCQQCGATDAESLDGDQGYTACCNERVVDHCTSHDCAHS